MIKQCLTLLLISLLLVACATRFAKMSQTGGECGYRSQPFRSFSQCLSEKLTAATKEKESLAEANSNKKGKASGESSDHLIPDFLKELDKISQQSPKKLSTQNYTLTKSEAAAYEKYDNLLTQYQITETELNKKAKQTALLVGVVAAAGVAAANSDGFGDSGGNNQSYASSSSSYSGNCPCPYDFDSAGKICGARSAYCRPWGATPICDTTRISFTSCN
jgi:hypothetical protein